MNKKFKALLISTICILGLTACSNNVVEDNGSRPEELSKENLPTAKIEFKDYGTVEVELYPHIAPNTVNNFIALANDGYYDGLTMHRIIKNFMMQGGDPDGSGMGGPGYSIYGEFNNNNFKNDLSHTDGVISMARSNQPNSAGSQFFIMNEDSPHLDGDYAAFGIVTNGMNIVDEIENVETDDGDKPVTDVIIESITVDTKGVEYDKPEIIEE